MEKTDTQTVRPVDVINDLYETECAVRKTTAAASVMLELFFERVYIEHEWDKGRHELLSNMFGVLTDQLFSLKHEVEAMGAKYEAMHQEAAPA